MPNQNNFRSDVLTKTDPRFLASRIVSYPEEGVLFEELPGSFGYDAEDNVEFHFYNTIDNTLILSTVTKLSDQVVKLHIVGYEDGTYKTYLQIDFTKLFEVNNLTLLPGDYKLTMNFFSDEIGSYSDRRLTLLQISPSRSEVELIFNNDFQGIVTERENDRLLREFLQKSFNKTDAIGILEKTLKSGVQLNNDFEGVTANNIARNIETAPNQTFQQTIGRLEVAGLNQDFLNRINELLPKLFEIAREEIIIKVKGGDERIQEDELMEVIGKVVRENISQLQQSVDRRIVVT